MKKYKPIIFSIIIIIWIFIIYKMAYGPQNDAEKYYQQYFGQMTTTKVLPIDNYIPKYTVLNRHYKTGFSIIGYKALSGTIYTFNFQDSISRKFFAVKLFDKNYNQTFSISDELLNKEVYVYVNGEDLKNSNYGTKQNPIPVLNFKGVKEPINITSNNPGSVNGYESLEPTQAEYEHNVLLYLKYIMTKDEFKKRFESGK